MVSSDSIILVIPAYLGAGNTNTSAKLLKDIVHLLGHVIRKPKSFYSSQLTWEKHLFGGLEGRIFRPITVRNFVVPAQIPVPLALLSPASLSLASLELH